jgi:nucleotide-binding universal stress UspA family protein
MVEERIQKSADSFAEGWQGNCSTIPRLRRFACKNMKTTDKARILCAVDFDVNSLAALDLARDLVRDNGGTLYVLHVVPSVAPLLVLAPLLDERTRHFARIRLDEVARESLSEVDYRLLLRTGHPAEQIIAAAAELNAKMVVLATHGRPPVQQASLGSVAERVIRGSPCPVLTIGRASGHESAHSHTVASSGVHE